VKQLNLETKVGIFFVVCFVIVALISLKLGNYEIGEARGYELSALFDTAAGLNDETPVLMAGLRIGNVTEMKLEQGRARVFFKVKRDTQVPVDSRISVQSRGFLGAKYLEIIPGKSPEFLKDGGQFADATLAGELSVLSEKAGDIADDVKAITANLRKVLGGDEGEEGIREIFLNLQEITARLSITLEDNQQRMNAIAANIERITGNMAAITAENRAAVRDSMASMPAIARNLEVISRNLATLSEANRDDLQRAITELAASSARLQEALTHIASITGKIDDGQGTIGKLVNNTETYDQLTETLDTVSEFAGRIRRIQFSLGYRGEYYPDYGDVKSYVSLRIQPQLDRWYEIAVVDSPFDRATTTKTRTTTTHNVGEPDEYTETSYSTKTVTADTLRISAQIAKRWYFVVLRGGLIENHAGVGTELVFFDDHLTLAVEASDFANEDHPRLKANMDFIFLDHLFLTAGADDIVHRAVLAGDKLPNWFFGAGLFFRDDDLTALLSRIPTDF
jgi:phospholipid/cholesterol/gamma-HCH transport system substrate-binding protein